MFFFTASVGLVYAETQDTVIIPFDFNGRLCGWSDAEETTWLCEWDPNRIDLPKVMSNGTDSIPDPVEASTTSCPDRFELQEDKITCLPKQCEDGFHHNTVFECVPDAVSDISKDRKLIPFDKKLQEYKDTPPETFEELDEMWSLERLEKCWYGLYQGRGIQTEDWFVTSFWTESSMVPKASHSDPIHEAMNQCRAQATMLKLLGDDRQPGEPKSRQQYWNSTQMYHGDVASDIPIWSQDRANQEANFGIDTSEDICDENLSIQSREYLGCTPHVYVDVGGYVTTQNDIEDKWKRYLEDDGEEQSKQIRADKLAEYNKKLSDKSNLYTPPEYSLTDQIKDIESQGWSMTPEADRDPLCNLDRLKASDSQYLEYLKVCGQ